MPLFVLKTKVLLKRFFLLKNQQITKEDSSKSTVPAIIKRPWIKEKH
jgi:hypothetical protein